MEPQYFENKQGMIQIEDKADIKERLGRAPGLGDAFIMLQWGFKQEYPKLQKKKTIGDYQGRGEFIGINLDTTVHTQAGY